MDKDKLTQRLMATFLGELDEHVRAFNRDLLALERDPGTALPEILRTLFRTAHSLKGAAHSVSIALVEAACHRLESLLGAARDGLRTLDADSIQLLFSAADALEDAGRRLREKRDLAGCPLESLLPRLDAAAARNGVDPPAGPSVVPAGPPPASSPPAAAGGDGIVRVPAAKLDALLARSSELLVARRRASARQEDLVLLRQVMEEAKAEWRILERPLRPLAASGRVDVAGRGNGRPAGAPARALSRRAVRAFERTRESLKRLERGLDRLAAGLQADQHLLELAAAPLEDDVRRIRMLPFGEACEGLDRVVRDLARAGGKEAALTVEGAEVELDRAILQALRDPLLHLVRNAVDHGLETPAEREAAGKPRQGRVAVSALPRGSVVEVAVSDDGRGLNLAGVREQARRRRLPVPEDDRELARLIFLPGLSTARLITELSGRGVGLDVVRHRLEEIHGRVDFSFAPGRGTRFVLTVPLTLTTVRALLLAAGGQVFAVPASNVLRLVRAAPEDLRSVEGREVLLLGEAPLPVASLSEVLGLRAEAVRPARRVPLVVLAAGDRRMAFAVDELLAEQEVVVKGLGPRLRRVRHCAGATLLPTGRIALILSAADLIEGALRRAPGRPPGEAPAPKAEAQKKRLLVVEDSVTTRSLVKSILEAAGYDVLAAADGAEAWQRLQEQGADLVVADVEMPRLDGFQLAEAIRGSKRFRDVPVVLVTALETDKDRARGLEAGADAYLPKSTFDQTALLEAIQQLL